VQHTECTLSSNYGGSGRSGGACYVGNGGLGGDGGNGGALFNSGALELHACTFGANSAAVGGGGGWESGLDVFGILGYGGSGGTGGSGGGIFSSSAAGSVALHSTLVGSNSAGQGGAGATGSRGNGSQGSFGTSPDLAGPFTDLGHNLIGGGPMLAPLADNGGTTLTMALLPGSPAIDSGDDALLVAPFNLAKDQRGFPRKYGAHVDIGAFELTLLSLEPVTRSGGDIVISFNSEIGAHYRIERSDSLSPASWTTVTDNIAGTGSIVQVMDSGAANLSQRFYRGRVMP